MSTADRPQRAAVRDRRHTELRGFLRSRGERPTPAAAGLPDTGRHRTPGLRRDAAGEFDMVGGPTRRASLDPFAPMSRVVVMGNASGAADMGLFRQQAVVHQQDGLRFQPGRLRRRAPRGNRRRAAAGGQRGDRGELTARVATLGLDRAVEAHRRIESGATTGRLVLEVVPSRPGGVA
ncbi:zinc-binding dehydrogenase [Nocardia sp. NPDC050799]|uniref:zinc-binding dehydrogenase n=1 Tax=Nocardia sp. NPDC050799 TaxID=3154842 RepID=UPI0033FBC1B5